MKVLLALAMMCVAVVVVNARGGDRRGGSSNESRGSLRSCQCYAGQCTGNVGARSFGCRSTRTQYVQCQETVCSVQNCTTGQLFNATSQLCEACPTGFHVDDLKIGCVCNRSTTLDRITRQCVACPKDATLTDDSCYCNNTAYARDQNACLACPSGSQLKGTRCQCTDVTKPFWNDKAFACQQCPGTLVPRTTTFGNKFRQIKSANICQCPSPQVFNKYSVSCVNCPTGSTVQTDSRGYGETYCACTAPMRYYAVNNTCITVTGKFDSSEGDCEEFSIRKAIKYLFSGSDSPRGH